MGVKIDRKWLWGIVAMLAGGGATPVLAADPPEWSPPVEQFLVAGNVYYVGTEGLAAYLVMSKRGSLLLDPTIAGNAAQIEYNIQSLNVPLNHVKVLISDHAHDDHVGAKAQIKRDTGARFFASAGDRWAPEIGQIRAKTTTAAADLLRSR